MSSELLRLREVMDKLRSPGGCPWDAEQDHESLLKYLLEESYEFIEAVENKDRTSMQEELGDLLLQVYFHSRMAEEDADNPFNVEDVAKTVTDKLIRRHPHVFGGTKVESSSEVLENWEAQKATEKGRTSIIDGVPLAQPALPLAAKVLYRMNKLNFELEVDKPINISEQLNQDQFGDLLLGLIAQAVDLGIDPEAALRTATKSLISKIQEHEAR
ncbi:MAG: nucleoside triphosphate hydrolase [Actinobacteria bacterium BACL4 MAG-120820-bin23]|jgi:XTP/dITP diphosphohydrolase|nr:MAG: nucleoside triphosphate hydrolase [Actinobacteria bacterium BACL4 MAG-121022-bin9]KRO49708.1 MAG: nucleoside triphosphate hydrolase [Actinobacteria bacterium BACL4 MAG-120820-bin23]KRO50657.1 MAG: nucleoside triphosphate hydrolase [Actinobacteria bacterium BACL4 MAG-121001-bin59]KRO77175.1 MAG: nucleoside triphosphate hydrolase [Actinobacteria bacterium BACL4 MAG-120920-bin74]KRO91981.1 MAG: nucleoside triphosphate hydrolase [Actinobacteria bacterium BACL4 MAG-120507-bin0]